MTSFSDCSTCTCVIFSIELTIVFEFFKSYKQTTMICPGSTQRVGLQGFGGCSLNRFISSCILWPFQLWTEKKWMEQNYLRSKTCLVQRWGRRKDAGQALCGREYAKRCLTVITSCSCWGRKLPSGSKWWQDTSAAETWICRMLWTNRVVPNQRCQLNCWIQGRGWISDVMGRHAGILSHWGWLSKCSACRRA